MDQLAAGIAVTLLTEEPSAFRHDLRKRAVTDQHGRFVMNSIVPGKYRMVARIVRGNFEVADTAETAPEKAIQKIELAEGEQKTLTLELKP